MAAYWSKISRWVSLPGLLAAFIFLSVGCASTKAKWNSRIGVFTYDQAVLELGAPDKEARLADGVIVADWLTRAGYTYASGPYGPSPYYGAWITQSPSAWLRLTFAADGKLQEWKRYYR